MGCLFLSIIFLYVLKFWFADWKKKRGRELILFLLVLWSPFSGDISSASIDWLDSGQEIRSGNGQSPALEVISAILDPLTVCKCLGSIPGRRGCVFIFSLSEPRAHISHSSRQRPDSDIFSFLWALASSLTWNSESGSSVPISAAPCTVALQEVYTCSRLRVQQTQLWSGSGFAHLCSVSAPGGGCLVFEPF